MQADTSEILADSRGTGKNSSRSPAPPFIPLVTLGSVERRQLLLLLLAGLVHSTSAVFMVKMATEQLIQWTSSQAALLENYHTKLVTKT